MRPGIVHRLDKDTSGLMMVAKDDAVQAALADDLKARRVDRRYLVLVNGIVGPDTGLIDAPVGRKPSDRMRMAVTDTAGLARGADDVPGARALRSFGDRRRLHAARVQAADRPDAPGARPHGLRGPPGGGRPSVRAHGRRRTSGVCSGSSSMRGGSPSSTRDPGSGSSSRTASRTTSPPCSRPSRPGPRAGRPLGRRTPRPAPAGDADGPTG